MNVSVLKRHPIAFCSSLRITNWRFPFDDFLNQPLRMDRYLSVFEDEIREAIENEEDTIDQAIVLSGLEIESSSTENLNIHGYHKNAEIFNELAVYGSDATHIKKIFEEKSDYNKLIHPKKTIRVGEIIWAARKEMARTVEDFLSRRTRHLLLDAKTSIEMAPVVAKWMAKELKKEKSWEKTQISNYEKLAKNYIP